MAADSLVQIVSPQTVSLDGLNDPSHIPENAAATVSPISLTLPASAGIADAMFACRPVTSVTLQAGEHQALGPLERLQGEMRRNHEAVGVLVKRIEDIALLEAKAMERMESMAARLEDISDEQTQGQQRAISAATIETRLQSTEERLEGVTAELVKERKQTENSIRALSSVVDTNTVRTEVNLKHHLLIVPPSQGLVKSVSQLKSDLEEDRARLRIQISRNTGLEKDIKEQEARMKMLTEDQKRQLSEDRQQASSRLAEEKKNYSSQLSKYIKQYEDVAQRCAVLEDEKTQQESRIAELEAILEKRSRRLDAVELDNKLIRMKCRLGNRRVTTAAPPATKILQLKKGRSRQNRQVGSSTPKSTNIDTHPDPSPMRAKTTRRLSHRTCGSVLACVLFLLIMCGLILSKYVVNPQLPDARIVN